jgi:hypothetical protein
MELTNRHNPAVTCALGEHSFNGVRVSAKQKAGAIVNDQGVKAPERGGLKHFPHNLTGSIAQFESIHAQSNNELLSI